MTGAASVVKISIPGSKFRILSPTAEDPPGRPSVSSAAISSARQDQTVGRVDLQVSGALPHRGDQAGGSARLQLQNRPRHEIRQEKAALAVGFDPVQYTDRAFGPIGGDRHGREINLHHRAGLDVLEPAGKIPQFRHQKRVTLDQKAIGPIQKRVLHKQADHAVFQHMNSGTQRVRDIDPTIRPRCHIVEQLRPLDPVAGGDLSRHGIDLDQLVEVGDEELASGKVDALRAIQPSHPVQPLDAAIRRDDRDEPVAVPGHRVRAVVRDIKSARGRVAPHRLGSVEAAQPPDLGRFGMGEARAGKQDSRQGGTAHVIPSRLSVGVRMTTCRDTDQRGLGNA